MALFRLLKVYIFFALQYKQCFYMEKKTYISVYVIDAIVVSFLVSLQEQIDDPITMIICLSF